MCLRRSLVRALDSRFALVFIHRVLDRPLSLPRVGSVKFHLFQDRVFRELLRLFSDREDRLQEELFVPVEGIGEFDVKFDVEVTRFVVSLRGHTLTMNDLQVTWRVSSVEC